MSETAWAAGFFDGEGTTFSNGRTLQLTVGQVNRDNLARFQAAVGGLGNVQRARRFAGRQPISRFAAYGPNAQRIVFILWPYLGQEKRDQALAALQKYAFRRVRDPNRCSRGHSMSDAYIAPDGSRECAACRRGRRGGPQARALLPTAIEARVGVREYVPGPVLAA